MAIAMKHSAITVTLLLVNLVHTTCFLSSRCSDGQVHNVSLLSETGRVKSRAGDDHARKVSHMITSNILMFKRDYPLFKASNKNLFQDNFPLHWVESLCPNTIQHFNNLPAFDYSDMSGHQPVLTTEGAMVISCMLRAVEVVAQKVDCRWYLHAGSALGAFVHGGPIPWDDDVDIIMDSACAHNLRLGLSQFSVDDVKFSCVDSHDGFKFYIDDSRFPMTASGWRFPFVDVFYFHRNVSTGLIHELTSIDHGKSGLNFVNGSRPMFERPDLKWPDTFFFNVRQYFFGGYFYWAPRGLAESRYRVSHCVRGGYNHRIENRNGMAGTHRLDCCQLVELFPFYIRENIGNGIVGEYLMVGDKLKHTTLVNHTTMLVMSSFYSSECNASSRLTRKFPDAAMVLKCSRFSSSCVAVPRRALDMSVSEHLWNTTVADRQKWKESKVAPTPHELHALFPNLDTVEIDNSISRSCSFVHSKSFRVVEFNAERGKHWIDLVALINSTERLRGADMIIFNELDVGMARSGNEHTARLLAFALGMNYAYGIEFVELTNGQKSEQMATINMTNRLGLHGNAIFSRCPIFNATNIRGPPNPAYFSDKATFTNAYGYEKRLGQRAILMAVSIHSSANMAWWRKHDSSNFFVLGAVHKLAQAGYSAVEEYMKKSVAGTVIIGGDQTTTFCSGVGLQQLETNHTATWRASCTTTGRAEGDIICGSANIVLQSRPSVLLPCYQNMSLSDHAVLVADFKLLHL